MPVIFTLASDLSEQLSIQSETRQTRQREKLEIKWKVKFDAEQGELIKTVKIDETEAKKLTGRQLFEKDRSLYDSDIKFISGEGIICLLFVDKCLRNLLL